MDVKDNKRSFCISVAGHTIAISATYSRVYELCCDYVSNKTPEFRICVEESDLASERVEEKKVNISRRDDYLETLSVYRKISEKMLSYDTFLMHGAVVAVDDVAYMFIADSGTGKTTHINKWLENLEDAYVVNGDKPLIKMIETHEIACGTPWCGKEHMNTNTMVPLRAIALMERAEDNSIEEISYRQAFGFLLRQTYWPKSPDKRKKTLELMSQMKGKVRFYKFCFNNMKDDVFEVAFNAMSKEVNKDTLL